MEGEKCIVCQKSCASGRKVCEQVICPRCERGIVLARVSDAGHEQLKVNLRKLWAGVPLRER